MLKKGKLNLIIDGQFGSTGKGLLAGWLAKKCEADYEFAVASCGPNAGHTFIDGDTKIVTRHLPMAGCAVDNKKMYICPGSILDVGVLTEEIAKYSRPGSEVYISGDCAEVLKRHKASEKELSRIGSTQKGTGAALVDKIMRKHTMGKSIIEPDRPARRASRGVLGAARLVISHDFSRHLMRKMDEGETGIMEISQGIDLSINGGFFPFCTSREISVAQALSDAGIHPHYLGNVFLSMRTYPIRVHGTSGPFYPDSKELTWEQLGVKPEITTVTKKVRRVATWSDLQFVNAMCLTMPQYLFINFMNYLPKDNKFMSWLKEHPAVEQLGTQIIEGWGPDFKDVQFGPKLEVVH